MSRRSWNERFLETVEDVGNRLPDPVTLFLALSLLVMLVSSLCAALGVSVVNPGNGDEVFVLNLLSRESLIRLFENLVTNFAHFHPLGVVLVTILGTGIAERSGLVSAALRAGVSKIPPSLLSAAVVFLGVMSSLASDAGYVVLPPIGALLFMGAGRHPIAGLAAAFAGVSGGYSANLLITSLDPLLSSISTVAAQLLDPEVVVTPSANYFFMLVSTLFVTVVGTLVTRFVVEPKLGKWERAEVSTELDTYALSEEEKRGLAWSIYALLGLIGLLLFLVIPQNAFFRDEGGGLDPFYRSMVPLLTVLFFVPGLVYGVVTGKFQSDKQVVALANDSMASMGPYIVLAFAAGQFVALFAWSNLGIVLAVKGAGFLETLGFTGTPFFVAFIGLAALLNLVLGSASAKWAVMAPVFVPMMMLVDYPPEVVQAAYRVADSCTNIISPLNPYLPIILVFARRYDKNAGIGTIVSVMLPYAVIFLIGWTLLFVAWMTLGIPFGF